jgi:hypothetical protein
MDYYVVTSDKLQPAFQDNHLRHPQWNLWPLVVIPYRSFEKKYRVKLQGNFGPFGSFLPMFREDILVS